MKAFKITALILAGTMMVSCKAWLDVDPKTEVRSDKLLETEQGFKDALTGCYLLMTSPSLYGRELTAGFLEAAGQQFTTKNVAGNTYYDASRFDYDNTESMIAAIWSGTYNVIANANNILEQIEGKEHVLHTTHYHIMKGEVLGLRGFLHFEMLRLFGWGDLKGNAEAMERMSIPYQFSYHKIYPEQYTTAQVLGFIIDDLEASAELLEYYDPWSTTNKSVDYYLPNSDGYYNNRMTHFNYWAARATLARVYMWAGEYDKALPIIEDFINKQPAISGLRWIYSTEINAEKEADRDMTFSMEHIFRLDVSKLNDKLKTIYDPYPNGAGTDINPYLFYITSDKWDDLYEVNGSGTLGSSDYRYSKIHINSSGMCSVRKFVDMDGYKYPNRMPLIRMSEMFYMGAECLNRAGKTKDAIELLDEVRRSRGIAERYMLENNPDLTAADVSVEIEKEWKKEFLGEGQMFHYYKRLWSSTMGGTVIVDKQAAYVIPLPEEEINNGGREPIITEEEEE